MGRGRKRSRRDYEDSHDATANFGMGQTLSALKGVDIDSTLAANGGGDAAATRESSAATPEEHWETVDRRATKKQKAGASKQKDGNYPSITHSPNVRLQSHVKISDLQALVLYLLADGPSPQWVAVRHHNSVRRVVVLMIPGLDVGMFTGETKLDGKRPKVDTDAMNKDHPMNGIGSVDGKGPTNDEQPTETEEPDASATVQEGQDIEKAKGDIPGRTGWRKASLSPDEYYPVKLLSENLPESLIPLAEIFPYVWPVKSPGDDKFSRIYSPLQAMLISSLPKPKDEKKAKGPQPPREAKAWQDKRTPITEFVASLDELRENEYPLHPAYLKASPKFEDRMKEEAGFKLASGEGWVASTVDSLEDGDVPDEDVENGSITVGRKIISMDCEMCKTEGDVFDVTRISLVSWDGSVILDELVKPDKKITDYVTRFSGITPEMLQPVTTTLQDIQARLLDILDAKTILIGHSLESDLRSLKLSHPFIADTSILYPHPRGSPLKSSLKWLAQKYLGREIQKHDGSIGHDSVEDARACLDLVKQKCEKGPKWGTSDASGESIFKRIGRSPKPKTARLNGASEEFRTGAVVDWGDPRRGLGAPADVSIGCENDFEVVEGVKNALRGSAETDGIPPAGVDFVWARLRGLEAIRGWWNRSKTADNAEMLAAALSNASTSASAGPNSDDSTVANGSGEEGKDAAALEAAVVKTVAHIRDIYEALPPCTAFIVYSGGGDPREMARLQGQQQQFRKEYATKKWDELSVQWTDAEEQALRMACKKARDGVGFVVVK